jgi:predicted aldo/keto reductase-like oxidoreductase
MRYRRLGRTGLKVSEISLGGGAFVGKEKTKEKIGEILNFAFENGINFIETAEDYGEEKIAFGIKKFKDEIILASKSFSSTRKEMEKSIKNSLRKLGVKKIDIYMLHTIDSVEALNFRIEYGVLDALKKAKSKGIVDWIGITGHRIQPLIEAIKTNEFDVVEVPYCIGAYESEKLFKVAKEFDVGGIAIRVFGGGILIDRNEPRKVEFMNPRNALAYVLSNKNVSTALIGVSSIDHLKEILKIKNFKISLQEKKRIESKVKNFLGKNFCRGCLACMPCSKYGWKFPIDQFLRMEIFYSKYKMGSVKEEYKNLSLKADACTECGECEKFCPYKVPIVEKLKNLHKLLS